MSKKDINEKNKDSDINIDELFEENNEASDAEDLNLFDENLDPDNLFEDDDDDEDKELDDELTDLFGKNKDSDDEINDELEELFSEGDSDEEGADEEVDILDDLEDDSDDETDEEDDIFDISKDDSDEEEADEEVDILDDLVDDSDGKGADEEDDIFDISEDDPDEGGADADDDIFDISDDDSDDVGSEEEDDIFDNLEDDSGDEGADEEDDIFDISKDDSEEEADEENDIFDNLEDDSDDDGSEEEDDIFDISKDDSGDEGADEEDDIFDISDDDSDDEGSEEDDIFYNLEDYSDDEESGDIDEAFDSSNDNDDPEDNSDIEIIENENISESNDNEFSEFDDTIKDEDENLGQKNTKNKNNIIMAIGKIFNKGKKEKNLGEKDTDKIENPKDDKKSIAAIMSGKGSKKKTKKHKHEKVRKTSSGGNPWIIVGTSVVLTTLTISISSILLKEQISDIFFMEQDMRISTLEGNLNRNVNSLSGDLEDLKSMTARTYLRESDFDNRFEMAQYEQTMNIQEIEQDLNRTISNINDIEGRLSRALNRLEGQDGVNDQIELAINEISSEMEDQKRLISRTVQTTLDVIQQSREMESRLDESIYERISTQVRDDMRRQRQELYDFSVIEDRLTTALNRISELTREINLQQSQNDRLNSEINELRGLINEVSEGQIDLEMIREVQSSPDESRNLVIEELTRNENNTISIERNRQGYGVDTGTEGQSNLPRYNVIALLEDRFYIRDNDENFRVFEIGDNFYEYGKILRIENNNIVTEKGIVRKQ